MEHLSQEVSMTMFPKKHDDVFFALTGHTDTQKGNVR